MHKPEDFSKRIEAVKGVQQKKFDIIRNFANNADLSPDALLPYSMKHCERGINTSGERQQWGTSWVEAPKQRVGDRGGSSDHDQTFSTTEQDKAPESRTDSFERSSSRDNSEPQKFKSMDQVRKEYEERVGELDFYDKKLKETGKSEINNIVSFSNMKKVSAKILYREAWIAENQKPINKGETIVELKRQYEVYKRTLSIHLNLGDKEVNKTRVSNLVFRLKQTKGPPTLRREA